MRNQLNLHIIIKTYLHQDSKQMLSQPAENQILMPSIVNDINSEEIQYLSSLQSLNQFSLEMKDSSKSFEHQNWKQINSKELIVSPQQLHLNPPNLPQFIELVPLGQQTQSAKQNQSKQRSDLDQNKSVKIIKKSKKGNEKGKKITKKKEQRKKNKQFNLILKSKGILKPCRKIFQLLLKDFLNYKRKNPNKEFALQQKLEEIGKKKANLQDFLYKAIKIQIEFFQKITGKKFNINADDIFESLSPKCNKLANLKNFILMLYEICMSDIGSLVFENKQLLILIVNRKRDFDLEDIQCLQYLKNFLKLTPKEQVEYNERQVEAQRQLNLGDQFYLKRIILPKFIYLMDYHTLHEYFSIEPKRKFSYHLPNSDYIYLQQNNHFLNKKLKEVLAQNKPRLKIYAKIAEIIERILKTEKNQAAKEELFHLSISYIERHFQKKGNPHFSRTIKLYLRQRLNMLHCEHRIDFQQKSMQKYKHEFSADLNLLDEQLSSDKFVVFLHWKYPSQ